MNINIQKKIIKDLEDKALTETKYADGTTTWSKDYYIKPFEELEQTFNALSTIQASNAPNNQISYLQSSPMFFKLFIEKLR